MKKYFLLPLFVSFILFTIMSCKKYLEAKSDDKLVVPTTLVDFQYLLDNAADMNMTTPSYACSSTDDYFLTDVSYNTKSIFFQSVYKWIPFPYRYSNDWSNCYKAIYNSNLCLERLALLTRDAGNAGMYDHIKGSALFYKAYYNLELCWQFAQTYDEVNSTTAPGIPLRNSTDFMIPSQRASVEESYKKVLDDLMIAIPLLDDMPQVVTRPSRPAVYALLARTYLSMRKYDSAFRYADFALQINSDLINYNDPTQVSVSATNPFKQFNKEVIFHAAMGVIINLYHPSSGPARIDSLLFASFHSNDLRKKAFFTAVAPYQRFKGSYTGNTSRLFSGIATDELWLMRAECNARLGNTHAALNDINILLQQRFAPANFIPVTATTATEALDIILLERRKELLFRGSLRWMDIKRLNKENRNIELYRRIGLELIRLAPNDSRYALPIPQDVIEASGMEQN